MRDGLIQFITNNNYLPCVAATALLYGGWCLISSEFDREMGENEIGRELDRRVENEIRVGQEVLNMRNDVVNNLVPRYRVNAEVLYREFVREVGYLNNDNFIGMGWLRRPIKEEVKHEIESINEFIGYIPDRYLTEEWINSLSNIATNPYINYNDVLEVKGSYYGFLLLFILVIGPILYSYGRKKWIIFSLMSYWPLSYATFGMNGDKWVSLRSADINMFSYEISKHGSRLLELKLKLKAFELKYSAWTTYLIGRDVERANQIERILRIAEDANRGNRGNRGGNRR